MNDYGIHGIFPTPIYAAKRDSDFDPAEKIEIENIIKEGMLTYIPEDNRSNFQLSSYIFDTKLGKLKEFCERHIDTYVKEVINPKHEMNFYITQSWLNIVKPGKEHLTHTHSNSIISGVFYIETVENDKIDFYDPMFKIKQMQNLCIEPKKTTPINSEMMQLLVNAHDILLFPSWLEHGVSVNEEQTTDRISLSFNVFAKGIFGQKANLNELIL